MATIEISSERLVLERLPLLNRLALSDEDVVALSSQGSISREIRGSKTIFRLRYRLRGRQRVRYVSPSDAAALEGELQALQKRVRARRRLADLTTLARHALRYRRSTLAALLEERGYHYHGYQIRRWRSPK